MPQIFRALRKKEYIKQESTERKQDLNSASVRAGKLLILFFALMLAFTFISRAAEALTQASVRVENPRADRLYYQVNGSGIISLAEEEYLNVVPGYRIDKVLVSIGDPVNKDTVLFSYKEEDLLAKSSEIETQIAKIELQIQQEKLNADGKETDSSEAPLLALQQAEANLSTAREKLTEAEQDYQNYAGKTKKELLEEKKEVYAKALKNYENTIFQQEKQTKLALRSLEDAKTAYAQANEVTDRIKHLTEAYKEAVNSGDDLSVYYAKEAIFEEYYGSKEAYENHKDTVYKTAYAMQLDADSLLMLQYMISYYDGRIKTVQEELQAALNSMDANINSEENIKKIRDNLHIVKQLYLEELRKYDNKLTWMSNTSHPSANELKSLRRNDLRLESCLVDLQNAVKESGYEEAAKKLSDFLLGNKAEQIEKNISEKKLLLDRATEDYDFLQKENEIKKADLLAELNELKETIGSMEDGSYDYEAHLEGKKQAVASAREAVRAAEQTVESCKLQYNNALDNKEDSLEQLKKRKESSKLILQGYQLDLEIKQKELDEVNKLLEHAGKVLSPWEGIVTAIDLNDGKITSGAELVKIGTGAYVYRAEFDRDMAGYAKEGSKIYITLAGEKKSIESEISSVKINEAGRAELKALLPEREYLLGERAEFKVTMETDRYNMCIPIQALREDNFGYFVYITREQDTFLGTEMIAVRVNVDLLEKNGSTAAVDGPLSPRDNVITDSSKYINQGDKIRVKG